MPVGIDVAAAYIMPENVCIALVTIDKEVVADHTEVVIAHIEPTHRKQRPWQRTQRIQ